MSKSKIIYIDDEAINLDLFELYFSRKYTVITGLNGREGLALLQEHSDVKVVISDMRMPGMTGLEFVRKAREAYPQLAYFILTGFEMTAETRQALADGVIQHYFKKPYKSAEIEAAMAAFI